MAVYGTNYAERSSMTRQRLSRWQLCVAALWFVFAGCHIGLRLFADDGTIWRTERLILGILGICLAVASVGLTVLRVRLPPQEGSDSVPHPETGRGARQLRCLLVYLGLAER